MNAIGEAITNFLIAAASSIEGISSISAGAEPTLPPV
jgi:hypothetical protein